MKKSKMSITQAQQAELGLAEEPIRFLSYTAAVAFVRQRPRRFVIFWGREEPYYWVCSVSDGEKLLKAAYRPEGQHSKVTEQVMATYKLSFEPIEYTSLELAMGYIKYSLRSDTIIVGDRGCLWICRTLDAAVLIANGYHALKQ